MRDALGAAPGDDVVFEPRDGEMVIRVVPRRSILAFAGAAAIAAPSIGPGKAELVEAVERSVAEARSEERGRERDR